MTKVYEQHDKHFSDVSAFAIVKNGAQIGTLAFKFPRDGAGRLYCYLHIHGLPMVRGYAGGYGYDKRTAAFESAARELRNTIQKNGETVPCVADKIAQLTDVGGEDFSSALREAGVICFKAV